MWMTLYFCLFFSKGICTTTKHTNEWSDGFWSIFTHLVKVRPSSKCYLTGPPIKCLFKVKNDFWVQQLNVHILERKNCWEKMSYYYIITARFSTIPTTILWVIFSKVDIYYLKNHTAVCVIVIYEVQKCICKNASIANVNGLFKISRRYNSWCKCSLWFCYSQEERSFLRNLFKNNQFL